MIKSVDEILNNKALQGIDIIVQVNKKYYAINSSDRNTEKRSLKLSGYEVSKKVFISLREDHKHSLLVLQLV